MQGDFYGYVNQGVPVAPGVPGYNFANFSYGSYPVGQNVTFYRNLERVRRSKKVYDGREVTNSTDESIHLVKSRKTGESAPIRVYDGDIKKRSQSGNSLGRLSNDYRPASHSDDRSGLSANELDENDSVNASHNNISIDDVNRVRVKKRRDRRSKKSNYSFADPSGYDFYQQYAQNYAAQNPYQTYQYPGQDAWSAQYSLPQTLQTYDPSAQFNYNDGFTSQSYDVAPGAPLSSVEYSVNQVPQFDFTQQHQQQYFGAEQGGFNVVPYDGSGYQSANACPGEQVPGLPPGAKIVAEYFLGYLDEQPVQQYQQQAQQQTQQQVQVQHVQQHVQPQPVQLQSQSQVQYSPYQQQASTVQCVPQTTLQCQYQTSLNCQPQAGFQSAFGLQSFAPQYQPCYQQSYQQSYYPYQQYNQLVAPNRNEVDVEVWEKCKDEKSEDLEKFKEDIIKALQTELGNLKLEGKEPIQPIFLMPKDQGASKPVYIPRNVYVPVIRPVFVPRERVIVRPQIIHVARPVLVDRPVPIQQRPIVIERDRPVPVRVETIEKTEPVDGNCTERNIENAQEVTYHEFTHTFQQGSGHSEYVEQVESEENRRKQQEVIEILEEAERRKQNLISKSNDDVGTTYKSFDLGASQGYTLEVLDQRVSDKFEKTDQETIKSRYGIDSFQYLPAEGSTANIAATSSYKSLNEARASNSSSNIFSAYNSGAESYGNVTQLSPETRLLSQSQGSVTAQRVNQSYSAYQADQVPSDN